MSMSEQQIQESKKNYVSVKIDGQYEIDLSDIMSLIEAIGSETLKSLILFLKENGIRNMKL